MCTPYMVKYNDNSVKVRVSHFLIFFFQMFIPSPIEAYIDDYLVAMLVSVYVCR